MKPAGLIPALVAGVVFGFGLSLSTMIRPEVVLSFLRGQDMGLLLVLGGATSVTLLFYQLAPRLRRAPLLGGAFGKHALQSNGRTIAGAALFGIGWGISGVCPGPAIAGLGAGNFALVIVVAAMALGGYVHGVMESRAKGE